MASNGKIYLAVRLLRSLEADQSQGSLLSQASDCAPVVQALGYYDLANFLNEMVKNGMGDL